jgi:hypothetical protein
MHQVWVCARTTIIAVDVGRRTVRGRRRGRSRCSRAPTLRRLAANIEVEYHGGAVALCRRIHS